MSTEEFMIELDGVINTIHTYTKNPFMVGYTKALREAVDNRDYRMIQMILDRVLDWYTQYLSAIEEDEYVFNKTMHHRAYNILKVYRQSIHASA